MPDLRFPHYWDFHDWCKEHMSDIIEMFPKIDESIEFEDMEVDNVYILRKKMWGPTIPWRGGSIIYIIDKFTDVRKYGYHTGDFWREQEREDSKWILQSSKFKTIKRIGFGGYYIIPVSSNDFSFMNWIDENPLEVK